MRHGAAVPAALVSRISEAAEATADELIGFVQDLVRIPSENPKLCGVADGGEAAVQDRVEHALTAIGCDIHRWDALPGRPNVVGVIPGAGGGPSLAVNGHVDVVPSGNPDDWLREHPPVIEWGLRGVAFPPVNTPLDYPGVQTLAECVNAVAGPARIDGFTAVADIAWFAEAGIPAVLFGPGTGTGAHGVDERVEIDQLVTGTKMLALMMVAWCGQAEE